MSVWMEVISSMELELWSSKADLDFNYPLVS